jgi:hypothetical protein
MRWLFRVITHVIILLRAVDVIVHILRVGWINLPLLLQDVILHFVQVDLLVAALEILWPIELLLFARDFLVIIVTNIVFRSNIIKEVTACSLPGLCFRFGLLVFAWFFFIIIIVVIIIENRVCLSFL